MSGQGIRAVIFDKDGVLIDTEGEYDRRRRIFFAENGIDDSAFPDFYGSNNAVIWGCVEPNDPARREELYQAFLARFEDEPIQYSRFLVPGVADTLRALGTWRRVETVIERCKFLVMMREGETREEVIRLAGLWTQRGAQIDFLDARKMDISSTQIREQIQKGLPFERLVPQAVADYIHEHGLYGAKTGMELNR